MANDEGVIKASELGGYDFGDEVAPEGYDNEASGYEDTPPGTYVFELIDFQLKPNYPFGGKDFGQWVGTQLRPRLRVADGQPNAGSTIMDFLPMPTKGTAMPRSLANRWANFIRAFGFQPPPDRLIPQGFTINHLLNGNEPGSKSPGRPWCRGVATVELDSYTDQNGKTVTKNRVKFFGYKTVAEFQKNGNGNGPAAANGGATRKPTQAAPQPATRRTQAAPVTQPVGGGLNMDDL